MIAVHGLQENNNVTGTGNKKQNKTTPGCALQPGQILLVKVKVDDWESWPKAPGQDDISTGEYLHREGQGLIAEGLHRMITWLESSNWPDCQTPE